MCDYCASHGGKFRWYLNPDNYSERFLEDKKRMKVLHDICGWGIDQYLDRTSKLSKLTKVPLLGKVVRKVANIVAPKEHSGQVISLKDALKMTDLADNLCVLDCMCRRNIRGIKESVCLNFGPVKELFQKLKPSENIRVLTPDEAKDLIRKADKKGLVHQTLMAKLPYPIVICNCELNSCSSAKARFNFGIEKGMMKGHEIAEVDYKRCDGCADEKSPTCLQYCQFGAIKWNITERIIQIDKNQCFGCGLCFSHCPKGAIELIHREQYQEISKMW